MNFPNHMDQEIASIQPIRNLLRRRIEIDHQRARISMPDHPRERQHVELAREPGDGLMSRVVKMQILDLGPRHRAPKQRARGPGIAPEDRAASRLAE